MNLEKIEEKLYDKIHDKISVYISNIAYMLYIEDHVTFTCKLKAADRLVLCYSYDPYEGASFHMY